MSKKADIPASKPKPCDHCKPKMSPPTYADLGKLSRDLFSKGYHFGFYKLDTTTRTGTGLEFKSASSHNQATGLFSGSIDVKYKFAKYGATLVEKWNTENVLVTELTFQDQLVKGSKVVFDTSFAPNVGKRTGKIKAEYEHDYTRTNVDVLLDAAGPIVTASSVVGMEGWLAGATVSMNAKDQRLTNHAFALGYRHPKYTLHSFVNNGSEFGGSVYHKVNEDVELSAVLGWRQGENQATFGLAGQYKVDRDLTVRGKVTNTSQLGLALTHTLKPGLKLTLSSLTNLRNIADGGQKFGIGIEFEA